MRQLTMFSHLIWGTALLCACSGTPKTMSRAELVKFIGNKEHGLSQEQEVNGIKVQVSYRPSALLAAQELGNGQLPPPAVIDSIESKYKKNYYFLLKYSKDGREAIRQLGDFSRYSDMVQVLSFQMPRFVNVTTAAKDTVPLRDYLFDQTYGMSDGNTVLLCFEKAQLQNKKDIEINVAECGFGTGNLKFHFEEKDIKKVPALDYRKL
ncbi:hypothetical protein [Longitalea arenae]|uniref:hypothetical protein n=1 Tax=Longitalea arenae TaxID=2812558 RepID=UPI0019670493|nr:hypothetical protein [Longitalea arenae]